VSTHPNFQGTVYSEATNLRFERGPNPELFNLVAGDLKVWNEVPCANYVSPVVTADLSQQTTSQYLRVSRNDPTGPGQGPGSDSAVWYHGHGAAIGLEILNKTCPTPTNPDPQAYVF